MKRCNYLVCLLLITLSFLTIKILAQDSVQTGPKFPFGVWATGEERDYEPQYISIDTTGFNLIVGGVHSDNKDYTSSFDLIAQNALSQDEKVYYYTNGMYTKWEAEEGDNTPSLLQTGIKHPVDEGWYNYLYGDTATYLDAKCWATDSTAASWIDTVIWGPNYRQEKNYRFLWPSSPERIEYTVKFRLALRYAPANPDTEVCKLSVFYRYAIKDGEDITYEDMTITSRILTVEDLEGDTFYVYSLDYEYPSEFHNKVNSPSGDGYDNGDPDTLDTYARTGIEFRVDWSGVGKLYIDYVEVYDKEIWIDYIVSPSSVDNQLSSYLLPYSAWNNIEYWFGRDEPQSIDYYEPMRIVDSLIRDTPGGAPIITQFQTQWNGFQNGDRTIKKYVSLSQPDNLMFDSFPFRTSHTNGFGLRFLQWLMQDAAVSDSNFWYVAQSFG